MPGRKNCVVAYANVRGLHANLVNLGALMAARRCDIMVSTARAASHRVLILWCDEVAMSVYVRQGYPCVCKSYYECSCHEVVCLRIRAKHIVALMQ